jgi:hypothetical protein
MGVLFFEIVFWLYFRIAVLEDINKAFDNLFYLTFCELGTYPDDETGDLCHMGLSPCVRVATYIKLHY